MGTGYRFRFYVHVLWFFGLACPAWAQANVGLDAYIQGAGAITIPSTGDTTHGQGTDPNAGKPALLLALPKLESDSREISPAEAQKALDAAAASLAVYDDPSYPWPGTWQRVAPDMRVDSSGWKKWLNIIDPTEVLRGVGFHAAAYRVDQGEILVAFEGTNMSQWQDIATDLQQLVWVPGQYRLGVKFVEELQKSFPDATLILTGHSLGGGIAQYAAAKLGLKALTFNPAGLFPIAGASVALSGNKKASVIEHFVTKAYLLQESADPITYQRQIDVQTNRDIVSTFGTLLGEVRFVPIQSDVGVFGAHSMARLYSTLGAIAQVNRSSAEDYSVIAVVDSSGSMGSNDPKELRLAAIRLMVDTLPENTFLSLIDFDSRVVTLFETERLGPFGGEQRKRLRKKLFQIDSSGGTEIRKGLEAAARLIVKPIGKVALVLLTDGEDGSWRGERDMLPEGVVAHAIALSTQADGGGLSRLSAATGGVFEIARSGHDLPRIIGNLFGNASEQEIMLVKEGTLKEGEQVVFTLRLPSYASIDGYVDVAVSWPGSDIDLVLIDPDGNRIPIDQAVRVGWGVEEATYDIIRLENPKAGIWTIELHGVDLPAGPESYTLRATSSGGPVRAKWTTNVVTPEVGQVMTFDLSTRENNVNWQEAEIESWKPGGEHSSEKITLGNIAAALGGSSGQTVLSLRPDEQGVHRVNIVARGVTDAGEPVIRTFDRTFQVAPPGQGVRYKHQIDPFIRRRAGML